MPKIRPSMGSRPGLGAKVLGLGKKNGPESKFEPSISRAKLWNRGNLLIDGKASSPMCNSKHGLQN